MSANFTPRQTPYKGVKHLNYRCMKVLPTVFDDALSYYEVLEKVGDKLNEVIEYVNSARLGVPQVVILDNDDDIDDFIDWEKSTIARSNVSDVLAYRVGDDVYFTLLGFRFAQATEEFHIKESVGEVLCYEYFPLMMIGTSRYDTPIGMYRIHEPNTLTLFRPSGYDNQYCCISGHFTVLTDNNHSFSTDNGEHQYFD